MDHGRPSDPIKVQRMRSLERARTACVASPACANWGGAGGPALLQNFTRFLLKNCEHTWGVSVQHFGLLETVGWANEKFHAAVTAPESAGGKIYKTLSDSWVDQLAWGIDWALAALPAAHPLRIAAEADLKALEVTALAGPRPASEGFVAVPRSQWTQRFDVSTGAVQLDARGAIVSLVDGSGMEWAGGSEHPLALLRYQSVTDKQFETEMRDSYLMQHNQTGEAVSGANEYGKPGQDENAHAVAQLVAPVLKSLWAKKTAGAVKELWLEVAFPQALHEDYGGKAHKQAASCL